MRDLKPKIRIDCFSEDSARVYEAWSIENKTQIDSLYIGATSWQYNREKCIKEVDEWKKKLSEKYEVLK